MRCGLVRPIRRLPALEHLEVLPRSNCEGDIAHRFKQPCLRNHAIPATHVVAAGRLLNHRAALPTFPVPMPLAASAERSLRRSILCVQAAPAGAVWANGYAEIDERAQLNPGATVGTGADAQLLQLQAMAG